MKHFFANPYLIAGILTLATPATLLAQQAKSSTNQRKEAEQIIITQSGDKKEKTVIEIDGDKVTVNGKDVKDIKDGNITIRRSKVRDLYALKNDVRAMAPGNFNFQWNDNDNAVSLFSEDANRAMLGVTTDEDDKGARITNVSKESAAEKVGLKVGDIITRIEDDKIEDAEDVSDAVHEHKPGDKISITILRDGKEQKLTAELGKWQGIKVNGGNFRIMTPGRVAPFPPNKGFNFNENWAHNFDRPRLGLSVQDSEDGKGVTVKEVEEESNAAKAGIKEGDVITHFNDAAINGVDDIRREMAENHDKISNKIKLLRNGKEQTLEVRTPRNLKSADL